MINSKISVFFCSACLMALFFAAPSIAAQKNITACGMGSIHDGNISRARGKAVRDAQRDAMEQGLGTLMDSRTIIENDELIQDRIYSRSSGYVKDYKIISEGRTNAHTYKVCIEAHVQLTVLENDLRVLGILKEHVGDKRFMTVYVPERRTSLPGRSGMVGTVNQTVNKAFTDKDFLVLDRALIRDVQNRIERSAGVQPDMTSLSALALQKEADLLLVVDVSSVIRTELTNKYFGEVSYNVSLQAVAPATAEIIASASQSVNVRTSRAAIEHADQSPMSKKKVRQLASRVTQSVLKQTITHFGTEVHDGTRYACLFSNFDQNEIFTIIGIIENLGGFKGKDVRNDNFKAFEMDIRYLGKKFEFQRELHETLQRKGIHFSFQRAGGNNLHLVKKGDK